MTPAAMRHRLRISRCLAVRLTFWHAYAALTAAVILGFGTIDASPRDRGALRPDPPASTAAGSVRTPQHPFSTWMAKSCGTSGRSTSTRSWTGPDGDRSFPDVFDEDTGVPWRKNGPVPVGAPAPLRYGILLPPDVTRDNTLTLGSTIHFRGPLGLWEVLVAIPGGENEGVAPPWHDRLASRAGRSTERPGGALCVSDPRDIRSKLPPKAPMTVAVVGQDGLQL